jgi:hypothetical protein
MKKRQEKENNEIKECTFQPNKDKDIIKEKDKKNKTKKFKLEDIIEKLYKEGLDKIKEKNLKIKIKENEENTKNLNKEIRNTHTPSIIEL